MADAEQGGLSRAQEFTLSLLNVFGSHDIQRRQLASGILPPAQHTAAATTIDLGTGDTAVVAVVGALLVAGLLYAVLK